MIEHTTHGMRGVIERLSRVRPPRSAIGAADFAAYEASYALSDAEAATAALAEFDAAPWFGVFDNRTARGRSLLVHQIEEMARHAGHAD